MATTDVTRTEGVARDVSPGSSSEPLTLQNTRNWTDPTPFSVHFPDVESTYKVWTTFLSHGIEAALDLIPADCDYLRASLPQFKRHKGEKVVLVLGTCRLKGSVPCLAPAEAYTEEVVASLERLPGVRVILIDLRKECRRNAHSEGCHSIGDIEAAALTLATAIEIAIAKQAFDIDFTKVISFSGVWGTQYYALQQFDRRLNSAIFQLPSVWIEQHLGHLGNSGWVGRLAKMWAKTDAFERVSQQLSPLLGFEESVVFRAF
nr:hypothetical protein B0A51_14735 [Rachicladosporium sp. CCFEE 5018]